MNLDGCSQSVKKEIEAIHDKFLEDKDESREFYVQKKIKLIHYLVLMSKVLRKKIKN